MPISVLQYPVTYLANVGPARAKLLKENMGISTYGDLLMQFPSKHIDRSRFYYSHELTPDMPYVQMRGQILSFEEEGIGRKRRIVAHFSDGHGIVDLVWFNGLQYVEKTYKQYTEFLLLYTWQCLCDVSKLHLPGAPDQQGRHCKRDQGNTEGLFRHGTV